MTPPVSAKTCELLNVLNGILGLEGLEMDSVVLHLAVVHLTVLIQHQKLF